jgi:hypothetical protein
MPGGTYVGWKAPARPTMITVDQSNSTGPAFLLLPPPRKPGPARIQGSGDSGGNPGLQSGS